MSIENFGILHGLNNTKIPEEDIVKAYESANEGNLISHLKKQEHYLKLSDRKVSNEMNLIDLKGCYSGHFVYPIKQLKEDRIQSYRITKMEERFIPESMGGKGNEKEKNFP